MSATAARSPLPIQSVLMAYGASLVVIAAASVIFAGIAHWTVFIPAILGLFVLVAWLAARSRIIGTRVAAFSSLCVAGIALMGTLSALPVLPDALSGAASVANPAGVYARSATAIASIAFVVVVSLAILRTPAGVDKPDARL
ncbi:MAG: hypothetical protein MUE84_14585 [Hyphomonas sp.]|nr:hypothetical protein [Hyphomonas sp.]